MCRRTLSALWSRGFYLNNYHKVVVACFITHLSTAYTSIYPFTYLPDMIRWFGYREQDKSLYAGFIASAYFTGSGLFAYFWGWLSDRKGRKPVLVFQLVATGVFCLLYGFCRNLYTAMAIRFMDGAVNGVDAVVNAIMYDHTDNSNQAFAVTLMSSAWGIGLCIGPLIAGNLATPAIKYPLTFSRDGLFGSFPYLIPSFIGFVFAIFSAIVVFVALPYNGEAKEDTRELPLNSHNELPLNGYNEQNTVELQTYLEIDSEIYGEDTFENKSSLVNTSNRVGAKQNIANKSRKEDSNDEKQHICKENKPRSYGLYVYENVVRHVRSSSLAIMFKFRGIRLVMVAYCMFVFASMGFWELLPVLLSTGIPFGGLGFNSRNIGLVMGTVSLAGLFLQLLLILFLEKRIGAILVYFVFAIVFSASIQISPLVPILPTTESVWAAIYVISVVISTTLIACRAMITVLINNCSPAEHVGAVNGLSQTLRGIFRAFAPVIGGNIFTASITANVGPPIDVSTAFCFFGVIIWMSAIAVYFLPRNLNTQNKSDDITSDHRDTSLQTDRSIPVDEVQTP